MSPTPSVLIVGTGLIGSSVGLALCREGLDVTLEDADAAHLRVAVSIGAGTPGPPATDPDLVVVAVPPSLVAPVTAEVLRRYPRAPVTDVGSTKQAALSQLRATVGSGALDRYVGSHPMAGSERSGPLAAQADLFAGRTWAVTPHPEAGPEAVRAVECLARRCSAVPVRLSPAAHDEAVALVSHLPQVAASVVGGLLSGAADDQLVLAGQGVRDVTRIAASDPDLWSQILAVNAEPVARLLHEAAGGLERFAELLDRGPALSGPADPVVGELRALLGRGVEGAARLPGKHGRQPRAYASVPVVVPDRPGALAGLFTEVEAVGVNIEDVRIDHSPGVPVGLVELFVGHEDEGRLLDALGQHGWTVHR